MGHMSVLSMVARIFFKWNCRTLQDNWKKRKNAGHQFHWGWIRLWQLIKPFFVHYSLKPTDELKVLSSQKSNLLYGCSPKKIVNYLCRTRQDKIRIKEKSKDIAGQCRTKNEMQDNTGLWPPYLSLKISLTSYKTSPNGQRTTLH